MLLHLTPQASNVFSMLGREVLHREGVVNHSSFCLQKLINFCSCKIGIMESEERNISREVECFRKYFDELAHCLGGNQELLLLVVAQFYSRGLLSSEVILYQYNYIT